MICLAADHHFSHDNIRRFTNRPFSSVEEMDSHLISAWNEAVGPDDTVYHLGDFTLGRGAQRYLSCLNGHIKVVPGGHDKRWIRGRSQYYNVEILPPLYTLEIPQEGKKWPLVIVLCHYALRVWDRSHYNSWHCFGHSHGRLPPIGKQLDVGVDSAAKILGEYRPFSLVEIREIMEKRPDNPNYVGGK